MKQNFLATLMLYAIYYPGGCDVAVPDHICDSCEEIEHGRVRSVAFIKKSYLATLQGDPDNPVLWKTGIEAKDIVIIPEVRGSYNGGDPQEGTGYGDQSTRLTGYNHELTFVDPNYARNAAFYNAIKYSRNYAIAWRTERLVHISDNPVSLLPSNPVDEDINAEIVWNVVARWSQGDLAEPVATPVGIFDRCFDYEA
jgi:hypothetical protein